MSLDVFVNGTGFGETIVLRWQDGGVVCGALIDCYAVLDPESGDCDILAWLKHLGIEKLRFAVATHPHLDHLQNFHQVLKRRGTELDAFYYWGVLEWEMWLEYFQCLLDNNKNAKKPGLREKAFEARELLAEAGSLSTTNMKLYAVSGCHSLFPLPNNTSAIEIHSFSPWVKPRLKFLRHVGTSITKAGNVTEGATDANAVSLGIIVKYGRSEIVLGGDVEAENWRAFRKTAMFPDLAPCLVKVSHHGSDTGCIKGMWKKGFLRPQMLPPIAIVTPWLGRLPSPSMLKRIRQGARELYVTGQKVQGRGRSLRSYVHVKVERDGNAEVVYHSDNAGAPIAL